MKESKWYERPMSELPRARRIDCYLMLGAFAWFSVNFIMLLFTTYTDNSPLSPNERLLVAALMIIPTFVMVVGSVLGVGDYLADESSE